MSNVIAEYDKRIAELCEERDTLLALVQAIYTASSECDGLDLGTMSRCHNAIRDAIENYRRER